MSVESAITLLYLTVPVISSIGWVPQIVRLVRNPSLGLGMSLPTWGTWSFTGLVSLLYSIVVVGDIPLIVTMSVNAAGQIVVFGYALAARVANKRTMTH